MVLTLITQPGNKNTFKSLIAAKYAGVELTIPEGFEFGKTNRTPEFLKQNPNGKVPVLITEDGSSVWESNTIARYVVRLSDNGLLGSTPLETAQIEQWIDFSTHEIDAPLCSWYYPIAGFFPYNKQKEVAAQDAVKKALSTLESFLSTRTFLVLHRITLADIVAFCNLYIGYTKVFSPEMRASFPNVTRYFVTLASQPEFIAAVGKAELAAAELKFTPPKKEAAKAAPAAPKAAAPVVAAEEEEEKAKPKEKNPLDLLPPTPMALDSWKRLYSNTPAASFKEIAVAGLWKGADVPNSPSQEHFVGYDPEGYSIWFCDYKYTDENTVNFVVMNKVGGFLQRIDYVRKYAFGVMAILKNDKGQFPIRGVWIFRGLEIPAIMLDECYDMELYDFVKADINDPAQRQRIEDILSEEATIDGLECIECKVFK